MSANVITSVRSIAILAAIRKLERKGHTATTAALSDVLEAAGVEGRRVLGKYGAGGSYHTRLNTMWKSKLIVRYMDDGAIAWRTTAAGRALLSKWREALMALGMLGGRREV